MAVTGAASFSRRVSKAAFSASWRELISPATIRERVAALGAEIDRALPPGPLTVVGVLRGAFVFMADLVRAIPRDLTCDFLGVRSYGDATVSSGVVEITSGAYTDRVKVSLIGVPTPLDASSAR